MAWIKAADAPNVVDVYSFTKLNSDEFVISTPRGLQKYNRSNNKWTEYLEFDNERLACCTLTGVGNNQMFALEKDMWKKRCWLNKIDLQSVQIHRLYEVNNEMMDDIGFNEASIFVNNRYHIIGGHCNTKHLILNDIKHEFETIFDFGDHIDGAAEGIQGPALIYIKPQNILLSLGGCCDEILTDLDTIWKYSLDKQKWELLPIKLPTESARSNFGYVLTQNQQFMIMMAGQKGAGFPNSIFVLDLQNWIWKQCTFNAPTQGAVGTVLFSQNNELIVKGYLRLMGSVIPNAIAMCIVEWCQFEEIHLIEVAANGLHWKINADCIFQNLQDV
eukprot:242064_1